MSKASRCKVERYSLYVILQMKREIFSSLSRNHQKLYLTSGPDDDQQWLIGFWYESILKPSQHKTVTYPDDPLDY